MTEKVFGTKKKGSLQDIPLPKGGGNTLDLNKEKGTPQEKWAQGSSPRGGKRKVWVTLVAIVLVMAIIFGIYSVAFHKAVVILELKRASVALEGTTFKAVATGTEGMLFNRTSGYTETVSLFVEGSKEENRQTKATGKIIVTNSAKDSKNYVKNTRFETPDGLVYRALRSLKVTAGGTAEVIVYADVPGEKYNSPAGLTFKVPGLKGTDAYNEVSAVQSEPITGGFSGIVKTPNEDELAQAEAQLALEIEKNLVASFKASLADNYIINEKLINTSDPSFTQKPDAEKGGIVLEANAELEAITFKKDTLESYIAQQILAEYSDGEVVVFENIGTLQMVTPKGVSVSDTNEFEFSFTGNGEFIWPINSSEVQQALAGKTQSHIENGLVQGVSQAKSISINISPFWRNTIPKNIKDINIITQ